MNPLLYDLKRSFLRRSTIILLTIFLLLGIGLTYLVFVNIQQQGISIDNKSTLLASFWVKNGYGVISGYILGPDNKPLKDVEVQFLLENKIVARNTTRPNGLFVINTTIHIGDPRKNLSGFLENYRLVLEKSMLHVKTPYDDYDVKASQATLIHSSRELEKTVPAIIYVRRSVYVYESVLGIAGSGKNIVVTSVSDNKAELIAATPFLYIYGDKYNVSYIQVSMGVFIGTALSGSNISRICEKSIYLREMDKPLGFYEISVEQNRNTSLLLCFTIGDKHFVSLTGFAKAQAIVLLYMMALSTPMNLVGFFIPIAVLYIAYVLMAKPRSIGALEIILAAPITRFDLYINRYLAGVLTSILSSAVVTIALVASSNIILGVPPILDLVLLMFIALTTSLIAFYSLYYFLATSLRSGVYLGLSIGIYLLFTIFWQTIIAIYGFATGLIIRSYEEYAKLLINSYYFNPIGALSLVLQLIQYDYGVSTFIRPEPLYIALSSIAWITIPVVLGYLRFRKIVLYS